MWNELLPRMVGGTITDDDAPDEPATIIGYELTETEVYVLTAAWKFGGLRKFFGVTARDGQLLLRGPYLSATVRLP